MFELAVCDVNSKYLNHILMTRDCNLILQYLNMTQSPEQIIFNVDIKSKQDLLHLGQSPFFVLLYQSSLSGNILVFTNSGRCTPRPTYCSAWLRLKLNTKMGLNHTTPHYTTPHPTPPHHQELLDHF